MLLTVAVMVVVILVGGMCMRDWNGVGSSGSLMLIVDVVGRRASLVVVVV